MPAWTDTSDKQLLLIMFQLSAPQLPKWDEVAARMGDGYTAESVRQHFQKLRKENVGPIAAGGAVKTPTKRTLKKTDGGSKSTGKRKTMKDISELQNADQDDEEISPTKKQKVEVKAEVKQDDSEDDGLL